MKELSIEDKAKRYDEAIERAKSKIKNDKNHVLYEYDILDIFTELQESEDEKIRKDVYNYLYNERHNIRQLTPYTDELDRWLAWLEKQKPINISIEDKRIRKSLINYVKAHGNGGDFTKEKYIAWLEKQGEQKPVNDTDEDIVEAVKNTSILDMVEPKFKVGDWVIDKQGIVHQIERVVENVTNHTFGYDLVGGGYFNDATEGVRLWTIQDAKAGDVLVASDGSIFLFAGVVDCACKYYVALTTDNYIKINKEEKGGYWETSRAVYPATKEQRDLLFKKMKEAGYEWDVEKKELRKIEQEQIIDYLLNLPKDNWEFVHEFVEKFGRIPKDEDELNVLVEYVLKRQKPSTWSEEDERILNGLISSLVRIGANTRTDSTSINYTFPREINWLKSLKDRMGG